MKETAGPMQVAVAESSLGLVLVAEGARGIRAVFLGDDAEQLRRELQARYPRAVLAEGGPAVRTLAMRVTSFIESPSAACDVPIDPIGTAFQQKVWNALREIAPGRTATYSEIASRIGHPAAVRAVGAACGANPIAVLVPCHRAVRTDGGLAGYRWGVERKRALLAREVVSREATP